jgi:hypothetical protein
MRSKEQTIHERIEAQGVPAPRAPRDAGMGFASDVSTISAPHYTTSAPPGISLSSCPRCGSPGPHCVSPGTPHHHQRLSCDQCGRWLRWLPRLRLGAQEERL